MRRSVVLFLVLSSFGIPSAFAQNATVLPDRIRGYQVHRQKIVVSTTTDPAHGSDAGINIGEPEAADISLTGIAFELPVEVTSAKQSGKIDFLTFHDFRVNDIPVDIEEYEYGFVFRRAEPTTLPEPVKIFLPTGRLLQAAWKEMRESQKEWTITGRVFVFGRFRKLGFYHRRVVPIDIDVRIKNPVISG